MSQVSKIQNYAIPRPLAIFCIFRLFYGPNTMKYYENVLQKFIIKLPKLFYICTSIFVQIGLLFLEIFDKITLRQYANEIKIAIGNLCFLKPPIYIMFSLLFPIRFLLNFQGNLKICLRIYKKKTISTFTATWKLHRKASLPVCP